MLTDCGAGIVFDIKRFSVHDGPGLRTTAFLKGCSLRCLWCHSPESQSPDPEILYSPETCLACGECAGACPHGLLAGGPALLDRSLCQACGRCAKACYSGALRLVGRRVTVAELVRQLDRDRLLHQVSGGGVTLSGGEPALQPAFSAAVLYSLRQLGHHTAIETAGNVPWNDLAMLLDNADLVFYDLKHPSDLVHRKLTGAGNKQILANLARVAELAFGGAAQLIVRLPVIPGLNDGRDDIESMADLLAPLPGVAGVQLLPYHDLGVPKYIGLARRYTLDRLTSPDRGRIREIATFLNLRGLRVSVEGID